MPLIKNRMKGRATLRTTANTSLLLTDFSVPYDTQTGTVQLQGSNVIGTNTSFTTKFSAGEFVSATVNSSLTEARVVNQVTNATFMNVTSAWTADNASTVFSLSERVDAVDIVSASFSSNGSWTVARGGTTVLVLHGTDTWPLYEYGQSVSSNATSNVVVTHSASATGTLFLEFAKNSVTANNQV